MRLVFAVLVTVAVLSFAGGAEAAMFSGAGSLPTVTKDFSPIQRVGCSGYGKCPLGLKWVCAPYGGCGCVSCGYARPYAAPRVYIGPRPYRRAYRYNY